MIPLHTPPGTKIVCVDANPGGHYTRRVDTKAFPPTLLSERQVYTVGSWIEDQGATDGFSVTLIEVCRPDRWGFSPRRFRLASLPRSLTDLLLKTTNPFEPSVKETVFRIKHVRSKKEPSDA